jgi:preprotein translocase subunit SecG
MFVAVFFATSLTLAYMSGHRADSASVVKAAVKAQTAAPADVPAQPAAPESKKVPQ